MSYEIPELICPICGSKDVVEIDGELVCSNCGYVLDTIKISQDYETRFFSSEEFYFKTRAPTPRENFDINIPTVKTVGNKGKEFKIPLSSRERTMKQMLEYLNTLAEQINMPISAQKEAQRLIKEFVFRKNERVKNLRDIVVAISFIALRITGSPRPLDNFLKAIYTQTTLVKAKKTFNKSLKTVKRILSIPYGTTQKEIDKLIVFMIRELKLSGKCLHLALNIYNRIKDDRRFIGKDPSSMAASIIYVASKIIGEDRPLSMIAKVASITESTLKSRGREIELALNLNKH